MQITDQKSLLSKEQLSLLKRCAKKTFVLGRYHSLDEILTKLNVEVIIEPGIQQRSIPSYLEESEKYWIDRLEEITDRDSMEFTDIRDDIRIIRREKELWRNMPLRGLYDPKNNIIKLFPEEMQTEYNGKCMDELLVSTLAHETMHAYFNRPRHKRMPYVLFVEEPLAEFGMLLYLKETRSSYYGWAHKDVSSKKTCYRYGAALMDQYLQGEASLRDYLKSYKIQLEDYVIPSCWNGTISLPQSGLSGSIVVGGKKVIPQWHGFFYDKQTETLGLDGDWRGRCVFDFMQERGRIYSYEKLKNIYIADGFRCDGHAYTLFSEKNVIVSPNNKTYKQGSNDIPLLRKDNTPCIEQNVDGLYKICRNGLWGVVDKQQNIIVPIKYGFVYTMDANELIMVVCPDFPPCQCGLVNRQGIEQVPLIYEQIAIKSDGTYRVKKSGKEYIIDKYGNRIH